ncbi:unnamed protein product [Lactuca virosa]|uniref:Uncharacterized protein n=1 Tax=Lactuca virosa TaxID=75947 RepID=A0AAU9NTU4_9ASTR|nr:unnamed protein product [Lactuca virosa]
MQEWLDEHKDEVVDNIEEKVLDGAGLIKEVATGHRDVADVDDEDNDEDEDADDDEDGHENPHFLIKDNGIQVDVGENAGVGDSFEEDMADNEDVYPKLPNIFNDKLNLKEQEPMLELTKLELHKCCFKPPLEFEGFLNLEKLLLKDIDFGASLCGTKVNLPQLKKLSLFKCTNVYNFNIKATRLQELIVYVCPNAMLLRLLDSASLFWFRLLLRNY